MERIHLGVLALVAGLLYTWKLGASGMANEFYASAVQAGTTSWKAMLFGSLDSGNAITVDKPPASLWPMEIAGRIFGFNSSTMLVPQAIEGVLSVVVLYALVRRVAGHWAGICAGSVLALTPAAALMFKFNNPDAALTLILTASLYALVRALGDGKTRWLVLAGVLLGLGFITKMGQAFLVLPGFGLAYLLAAPVGWLRRIWQLLAAGAGIVVGAGWWMLIVALTPASQRPYIGGSGDNTVLGLALGYNGLGRLFGGTGNGGGMGGNAGFGGATGVTRLLSGDFATEIGWTLPAALVLGAAALVLARSRVLRGTVIGVVGWLVVTGGVFSFMEGTIHPYYSVALAPAVAGLIALGGAALWAQRDAWRARLVLAVSVVGTAAWSAYLLKSAGYFTWVGYLSVAASAVFAMVMVSAPKAKIWVTAAVLAGALAGLGGSGAYTLATINEAHTGSIPSAGPVSSSMGGGMGNVNSAELNALLSATTTRWAAASVGSQSAAPYQLSSRKAVMSIGGFNGSDDAPTLAEFKEYVSSGQISYFIAGGGMGQMGGNSAISEWVSVTYTAETIGGITVYDLR